MVGKKQNHGFTGKKKGKGPHNRINSDLKMKGSYLKSPERERTARKRQELLNYSYLEVRPTKRSGHENPFLHRGNRKSPLEKGNTAAR